MTDYHPQGLWGTGDTAALRGVEADTPKHVAAQKLRSYWSVTILTSQDCFHSSRSQARGCANWTKAESKKVIKTP